MTPPDFKPSQVELDVPPLAGTMGHAEAEHAAFLLVRACQFHGDTWAAHDPRSVLEMIQADVDSNTQPMAALNKNPFFNPAFGDLTDRGFARYLKDTKSAPVEFTDKGFEALRKWVRK